MQKVSLTIRVDAEDLKRWKAQSGGNLSGWIRGTLNEASTEQDLAKQRMAGKLEAGAPVARKSGESSPRPAEVRNAKSVQTCKHGTAKGVRCWQCGGLAVME